MMPFKHNPITEDRSIRVIRLHPAALTEAPIQCDLNIIPLEEPPDRNNPFSNWTMPYEALSYTWDGQACDKSIICNGNQLLITANAEAAMRSLRTDTDERILWIDGICIDQTREAVAERNQQVALMGEIYKKAKRVMIWLGDEDAAILKAFEAIKRITSFAGNGRRPDMQERRRVQDGLRQALQDISDGVDRGLEEPFSPLLSKSWFNRCWTLQEATMPTNPGRIILRCGQHEIPFAALNLTIDGMKNARYKHGPWREAMSSQNQFSTYLLYSRFPMGRAILDDNAGDIQNTPLAFSILINVRRKKAAKPEDKIFALHGVLTELGVHFPSPDYTKSVETIYREATVAAIKHDKVLHVLYHAPSDQRRDELASWVPDWETEGWKENDPRYGVLRSRFAASGGSPPLFDFTNGDTKLVLRGRIIDTIIMKGESVPLNEELRRRLPKSVSQPWTANVDGVYTRHHQIVYPILQQWLDMATTSEYPTGESPKEAFKLTLTYDFPEFNKVADVKIVPGGPTSFNSWYDVLLRENTDSAAQQLIPVSPSLLNSTAPPSIRGAFSQLFELPGQVRNAVKLNMSATMFYSMFHVACGNKCFFLTERGYFGTAPDPLPIPTEAGDVIAVVSGLEMPLILRPTDGGFRLLTHAHVHGVMYGEKWPEQEDSLDDIVLI